MIGRAMRVLGVLSVEILDAISIQQDLFITLLSFM